MVASIELQSCRRQLARRCLWGERARPGSGGWRSRSRESASDELLAAIEIRTPCFSEKRSSAKGAAGRGVDRNVGGVAFDACFHANARVRFVGSAVPPCAPCLCRTGAARNARRCCWSSQRERPRRARRWTFLLSLRMGQSPYRSSSLATGRRVGRRVSRGVTRRPACVA